MVAGLLLVAVRTGSASFRGRSLRRRFFGVAIG